MPVSQERLGEIAAIADEAIDTTDIPEADEAWFEGAKLVRGAARRCGPGRSEAADHAELGDGAGVVVEVEVAEAALVAHGELGREAEPVDAPVRRDPSRQGPVAP